MSRSPSQGFRCKAFVFDLDGTLIDTTPLVIKHWRDFANEHDLDPEKILESSHGRRTIETIARWVPELATPEVVAEMERKVADQTEGVSILPGVRNLLDKIPQNRIAVCTAGTEYMATTRLKQCEITLPKVMATGDRVTHGKPHPESYLLAAHELGYAPEDCLVFEDAPAGVKSGRAAGMQVIACTTTHSAEELRESGATKIVQFLSDVEIVPLPDGNFEVLVSNAL
ncbi:2-deoxyglucose-6-phosphate phosphatase [Radiomyces spectabilis]|uniref:2-deoxyglucose-6-phosphate phosphatase n=1 Tax=Radiomyces spectabilis TaxID=64574 RepID=UPI00222087FD|nr:2-deoxyglucose-6-phosphate phosphatase [Radiomyces spectabilis]KAI8388035.1 2-deoxyglucose-6-phosphate phosphatase [Radiomyces spectabilis]